MFCLGAEFVPANPIDALLTEKHQQLQQMTAKKKAIQSQINAGYRAEQNLLEKIEELSEERAALQKKNVQPLQHKSAPPPQQSQQIAHRAGQIHKQKQALNKLVRSIYMILKGKQVLSPPDFAGQLSDKNTHLMALVLRQKILHWQDFDEKQHTLEALLPPPQEGSTSQKVLEQKQQENQRLLSNLQQDQQVYFHYLDELQQSIETIQEALDALETQKMYALQFQQSQGLLPLKGKLPPPIAGKLLRAFRKNKKTGQPIFQGITIAAAQGGSMKAVALGKVVFAGALKGYGQLVIVDHGKNSFSVYGNLEQLAIKEGDYVGQDSVLGTVFSQAGLGKFEAYFEIRHNGASVNPLRWLKAGSDPN